MAFYSSWTIIQLAMIFDANLVFLLDVSLTNAAFITSSIMMGYYLIYWIIDMFVLRHNIQISFMYYSIPLYYLSSLCYKRGSGTLDTLYGKYIVALILLCIMFILVKIVISLVRMRKKYEPYRITNGSNIKKEQPKAKSCKTKKNKALDDKQKQREPPLLPVGRGADLKENKNYCFYPYDDFPVIY